MTRAAIKVSLFAATGIFVGLVVRWIYASEQMTHTWAQLNATFGG